MGTPTRTITENHQPPTQSIVLTPRRPTLDEIVTRLEVIERDRETLINRVAVLKEVVEKAKEREKRLEEENRRLQEDNGALQNEVSELRASNDQLRREAQATGDRAAQTQNARVDERTGYIALVADSVFTVAFHTPIAGAAARWGVGWFMDRYRVSEESSHGEP